MEQFANLYSTTLASSYTAGDGHIVVASATGAPSSGTFSLDIISSGGTLLLIFRVTSVSGTTFTGAAEGADASAGSGSTVVGTMLTAAAVAQIKTDALANLVDAETPSGTIDGSNTGFTVAHAPSPTGSLKLYLNGVLQIQGTDYTLATAAITFTVAPETSATLIAFYRY